MKKMILNNLLLEVRGIPEYANKFIGESKKYSPPSHVPYLGMGSSYFAAVAFKYLGLLYQPEIASEYYNYISKKKVSETSVIISQSGQSTECLLCKDLFEKAIVITNNMQSQLAMSTDCQAIDIMAGTELYSSSKTYINTLLALSGGFGYDQGRVVKKLSDMMEKFERQGKDIAEKIAKLRELKPERSYFITGSGPNIATALQAALILSETTKIGFNGIPLAQYDHGPKETALDSIVIHIMSREDDLNRLQQVSNGVKKAGANVFFVGDVDYPGDISVFTNIIPFNFLASYLADYIGVEEVFQVGNKVTESNKT